MKFNNRKIETYDILFHAKKFGYNKELIDLCKMLGANWSSRCRKWYLPEYKFNLNTVFEAFREIAWIDYKPLSMSNPSTVQLTREKPAKDVSTYVKKEIEAFDQRRNV